jgi:chromosome segregation ATPase
MANIINWDENPLAQELEKERAVSAQLIKQRDEAREEVERLRTELAQAISERTPHDYGILKDQRDEARAEVEERKEALLDAATRIDELTKKRDDWFEKAKAENDELLLTLEQLSKARAEVAQLRAERDLAQQLGRDEVSAELERLRTELAQAISERTPHDYGILKYEIECLKQTVSDARIENSGQAAEIERLNEEYRVAHLERQHYKRIADHRQKELCALVSRPDPCRLEIAALLLANDRAYEGPTMALKRADALIAAAKEVAK